MKSRARNKPFWLTSIGLFSIIFIILPCAESRTYEKCLLDEPEVLPKRFLHFEGQSLNITLEMSSLISHQLSTHVFKIFLQEILGYPKVEIIPEEDNYNVPNIVDRLSGPSGEENNTVPRTMINLEVLVSPDFDTTSIIYTHHVRECGTIAPPVRFGWFMPIIQEKKNAFNSQDIHWTVFKDSKNLDDYDIQDANDWSLISRNSVNNKTYYCPDSVCDHRGMFIPEQCKGPQNKPCAVLLAPYYNVTKFVIGHIKELKLFVKVVWLGPNLKSVMQELINNYRLRQSNKKFMILSWSPSEVIQHEDNFTMVNFKRCELLKPSVDGCKYDLQRLVKLSWSKLEQFAKVAYESLHKVRFSAEDYDLLLQLYNEKSEGTSIADIACKWMRQRNSTWKYWIVNSDRDKNTIFIGGIFPITGSSYTGTGILQGALMAKDAINKNSSLLHDYQLELLVANGQCKADMVMKAFIDYIVDNYYSNLIGVLGPACSDTVEPLAGVSKHYRTMVISYSAEGASFSNREKYPYFFRTIGENKQYKHVYLQMFKELGWKRIAALTEDGQKYTEYISHMQDLLQKEGISFIANSKFPRERDVAVMTRYLEDLKSKRARIIIADVYDEVARSVMCEAFKLGMTAKEGYVWFLPLWLNATWYNTSYFNTFAHEKVNCTTKNMIEAINGYFSMTSAFFAPDDVIMPENITVGEWRERYEKRTELVGQGTSNYAGFAYDAVWTYALALDKLIKEDPEAIAGMHSENTTNKLVNLVKATDFNGVSGRIKFRGGPSRFSIIHVVQWINNDTRIVGYFHPNISDDSAEILGGTLKLNTSAITWFSPEGKPDDGYLPPPPCMFGSVADALSVECYVAGIIINGIVGFIGLISLLVIVFGMKRYFTKKLEYSERVMKSLGIDLLDASNIASLDRWEIPREFVVINRKLGEGAFGTVYGGEANFSNSGWIGVAVKSLKRGSSTEEKLDFLSEAEVMKRLDHKNIVRLLGVCTKGEPVCTVMEFMLFGDLKTFLLARRHLVNNKTAEEAEQVSNKKLTGMALDVARGLSYLAQLKYVHRDIALRNCLVNAQKVIKLADFGMTRPMFENDYYKFNRKGMLPVRWMAPESLTLGVFSPASDVWSYGVLLYEIITFGSFPFQGLTNNQVLDYVKLGNTVSIPHGIKTQLEGLIKSCWHQDSKMRPAISEIVAFLANNPRLIAPCLDIPLSSVQMEDTGQLEMDLPEQFRKCSIPLSTKSTLPNGISSSSFDSKLNILRQNSLQDSGVLIPLDKCCPREPLLGPPNRSDSFMGLSKYVSVQHNNQDDEYCQHNPPNVHAITKL